MKKTLPILLFLIPSLTFVSCKKDSDETPVTYPNYSQLKIGNYWIYERYNVDPSGFSTPTGVFDSCYVEKDTLINGYTYFKVVRPSFTPGLGQILVRDSLHYLVGIGGTILFSSQNFTQIFEQHYLTAGVQDTIAHVFSRMTDKDLIVNVPAGNFPTSCFQQRYKMYPNWASNGNPRSMNTRYALNVGIVTETLPFFSSSPNYTERRLVRFHVNP